MFKFPKSDTRFGWTRHIKNKMVFYHISPAQVMRIFRSPQRREEGIAPKTVASMVTRKRQIANGKLRMGKQKQEEIWLMYQLNRKKVVMISTWRYPGKTKPGERPVVPADALAELKRIL